MQLHDDGTLVVSATDLVGFLECDHLVTLEEARARGELEKPYPRRPAARARSSGAATSTSARYIERLRAAGPHGRRDDAARAPDARRSCAPPRPRRSPRCAPARTSSSRRTFFDGRWRGHPDFLLRRDDRPSDLGSWSYDIADTKLARRVKAAAHHPDVRLRGPARDAPGHPARDDLGRDRATGRRTPTGSTTTPRTSARPSAASRRASSRPRRPRRPTYPEPVDHCRVCSWWIASAWTGGAPTTTSRSSPGRARVAAPQARRRRASTTLAGLGHCPSRTAACATSGRGSSTGSVARPPSSVAPRGRHRPLRARSRPTPTSRARASPRCRRRRGSTCSSTSRRTRGRSTTGSSTCSAGSSEAGRRRARVPRAVGARPGAGEGDARGASSTS